MKTLKFLILITLVVSSCQNSTSKEQRDRTLDSKYEFTIDQSCGFDKTLIGQKTYTFNSDQEAEDLLEKIMSLTGLPANFEIRAASIDNACAVIKCDNSGNCDRYILYSQEFMEQIKDATNTHFSEIAVLAHEIAHHLSGHTLTSGGNNYDMELEADKFAGFMLYKLGASIEETKRSYSNLPSNGSKTHPPKTARIAAVTNGWFEAKRNGEQITNISSLTKKKQSNSASREKQNTNNLVQSKEVNYEESIHNYLLNLNSFNSKLYGAELFISNWENVSFSEIGSSNIDQRKIRLFIEIKESDNSYSQSCLQAILDKNGKVVSLIKC